MKIDWLSIRRRLLLLKIPDNVISKVIGKGGPTEVLCVIPVNEIMNKGISYVLSKTDEGSNKEQFDSFWNYDKLTWMSKNDPKTWNI